MSASLTLPPAERDVALDEVRAVLAASRDEDRRRALETLVDELEDGTLSDTLAPALEQIVTLGLQTGRIRALYGPGGEQTALRLHRRLPEGAAVQEAAREVTAALSALRGRALDSISIAAAGPGAFSLALRADGIDFTVRLDRQGVRLSSVGV